MTEDIAISVHMIAKRYSLNHKRTGTEGLRHVLQGAINSPFKKKSDSLSETAETKDFWALRDVSFELRRGEVAAIIGRNGAGKSTLLKVLSRITEPTKGRADIYGRIASLLEVGTGFQPELTGRENVFLNGAILGMTRAETRRKFDEIVNFSEVEKFLDTPVKYYSSGMYVRLAFSVAAHLEPEILIVDEVLAVGDTAFQQKCLEKISSIGNIGGTILFVSHNLSTVRQLCSRGILLSKGTVAFDGSAREAIAQYVQRQQQVGGIWEREQPISDEKMGMYFISATIRNGQNDISTDLHNDEKFTLEIKFKAARDFDNALVSVRFTNQDGVVVFTTCNTDEAQKFILFKKGIHNYRIEYDALNLPPGRYALNIAAFIPQESVLDVVEEDLVFTIHDIGGHMNLFKDNRLGVVCPILKWTRI